MYWILLSTSANWVVPAVWWFLVFPREAFPKSSGSLQTVFPLPVFSVNFLCGTCCSELVPVDQFYLLMVVMSSSRTFKQIYIVCRSTKVLLLNQMAPMVSFITVKLFSSLHNLIFYIPRPAALLLGQSRLPSFSIVYTSIR